MIQIMILTILILIKLTNLTNTSSNNIILFFKKNQSSSENISISDSQTKLSSNTDYIRVDELYMTQSSNLYIGGQKISFLISTINENLVPCNNICIECNKEKEKIIKYEYDPYSKIFLYRIKVCYDTS